MEGFFNNTRLLDTLWKWRFHIILITLAGALLGMVFSAPYFIPPRYKSFALLYPAILNPYADENESEQMLQWLESRDIAENVITMFDLGSHYNIRHSDRHFKSRVFREFQRNLSLSITRFESVKIEITDHDPRVACDMVFAMIDLYNIKVNQAHRKRYREILEMEHIKLTSKRHQLDSLMGNIIDLRINYGLIDYGIQTGEVTRGYLGTFDGSSMAKVNINEVKRLKDNIQSRGDSLLLLTNLLTSVTHTYSNYMISYEDALRNVNKELSFASIVSNPVPADRKSHPVRWVIVLVSAAGALVVSLIVIMIIEQVNFIHNKL